MTPAQEKGLKDYIRFYENLTPDSLKDIGALLTPDATFRDQFNDVKGVEKIRRVFEDMFENIGKPDFKGAAITVDGMSAVTFAGDGRVSAHIDYWDAAQALYEYVPALGWILRRIRAKIAA